MSVDSSPCLPSLPARFSSITPAGVFNTICHTIDQQLLPLQTRAPSHEPQSDPKYPAPAKEHDSMRKTQFTPLVTIRVLAIGVNTCLLNNEHLTLSTMIVSATLQ
jgi:hypothetical protein